MELMSRLYLYNRMMQTDNLDNSSIQIALRVNYGVLNGIESQFLSDDNYPEQWADRNPEIMSVLSENLMYLREQRISDLNVDQLLYRLESLLYEYSVEEKTEMKHTRGLFNQIIRELAKYNSKSVLREELPEECFDRRGKNQVFLSHAYVDRLYARALFDYFLDKGIYLYVDWMHHDQFMDGRDLKDNLEYELSNSDQLLYLRTVNSELNIQGKQYIRPWCCWELGNFYGKRKDQKYMINLYSVEEYGKSSNVQLHGLKLYTGTNQGMLFGRVIVPV